MDDNYILRSLLFVPGNNERLINSSIRSDADCIIFDVEDSVQPDTQKIRARSMIRDIISQGPIDKFILIRINDIKSGLLIDDLDMLTIPGVHGFMPPKANVGSDIYFIDKLIETLEHKKNIPIGTFKLVPLIESGAAVLNSQDICKASKRVIAIAYGSEDFVRDIKGIHDPEDETLFTPRSIIAMAARANNVIPIDTVHIKVHDLEDLEKNLKVSRKLGFEGMLTLHPKEIPLIHEYFTPSVKEYQHSLKIIQTHEKCKSNGKGVVLNDGKLLGPPMISSAIEIVHRYELINQKNNKILKIKKAG